MYIISRVVLIVCITVCYCQTYLNYSVSIIANILNNDVRL